MEVEQTFYASPLERTTKGPVRVTDRWHVLEDNSNTPRIGRAILMYTDLLYATFSYVNI